MTDDPQKLHAGAFGVTAKNLMALADALVASRPPNFTPVDVASIVLSAGVKAMLATLGAPGAVETLTEE